MGRSRGTLSTVFDSGSNAPANLAKADMGIGVN